jgi:protocatechuate 3,4-dioxygenase beta subunit
LSISGSVGLGALLAACRSGDETLTPGATDPSTSTPTTVETQEGTTATVSPTTETPSDLVTNLDAVDVLGVMPETTEGPYWFDVDSIRSDVREDRPGTTLQLALRIQDADDNVLPNSVVEIWHCDAGGDYSGFEVSSTGGGGGGAPGRPDGQDTSGQETSDGSYSDGEVESAPSDDGTYLRGAHVADDNGIVQFTTIYPGWYRGRTVHIHCRVHIDKASYLTTQLFFDDELSAQVYAAQPYSQHSGRDTYNDNDSIYVADGLLHVETQNDGYLAYLNLGVTI